MAFAIPGAQEYRGQTEGQSPAHHRPRGLTFGLSPEALPSIIGHVYMTTMGHKLTSHIKPMITGYDDIDDAPRQP